MNNVLLFNKNVIIGFKKNNYKIVNYAHYKFWDIDYS